MSADNPTPWQQAEIDLLKAKSTALLHLGTLVTVAWVILVAVAVPLVALVYQAAF